MKILNLHGWDLDYAEAVALQADLAAHIQEGPPLEHVDLIAAADVSGGRKGETIACAVVVMRLPGFEVVEVRHSAVRATWPYVPGALSFREAPAVLAALEQLHHTPDVLLCDGQGRAHPRRLGLASHVGLWMKVPTIGCAKSLLTGQVRRQPGRERGSRAPLLDGRERIGTVLRTRTGVKPVYVSVGHRIDLASAERWVLEASRRFRLPEPSRLAHQEVTRAKRGMTGSG